MGVGLVIAILIPVLAASALELKREGQTGPTGRMFKVMTTGLSLHTDQNENRSGHRGCCQDGGHRQSGADVGHLQACLTGQWLPFYLSPSFHRAWHSLGGLELTLEQKMTLKF